MKERPILFSAPMVRAILDGSKTQTRRIIKPKKGGVIVGVGGPGIAMEEISDSEFSTVVSPYGEPGDSLWVRETFSGPWCMEATDGCAAHPPSKWGQSSRIWYWADGEPTHGDWTRPRPSIHMPRWASRINLENVGVRIERLNDISKADAIEEGLFQDEAGKWITWSATKDHREHLNPVEAYRELWESINGAGSWDINPFVWAISFNQVQS